MRTLLYVVFAFSGAAGLMYEMVWSRYLALLLGHSAYAQVLVIAIFLGGMALGAALAAGRSARLGDPLKGYVAAELVIGGFGIFFHDLYGFVSGLAYSSILPAAGSGAAGAVVSWFLAILLILPQSVLLGATFPLMAAGLLRRGGVAPGRGLALLYFTNSLGAAAGALLGGFYFVASSGLPGTTLAAGMLNLAVALVTLWIATRWPAADTLTLGQDAPGRPVRPSDGPTPAGPTVRLLLAVSFGTAVASFAYEIGWLRMLALVLGSATHSFEIMLSAFISGLAFGAFWVRRRADRWTRPLEALGIVQVVMGLAALATLALYGASFRWMQVLLETFARTDGGYTAFSVAKYGISLAIMFPASFFAGMTLPLITRTLLVSGAGERAIGQVYSINTLGAIVGVAAAGLVGLPLLGLKGLVIAGGMLDIGIGLVLLARVRQTAPDAAGRPLLPAATTIAAVAVLAALVVGGFDARRVTSGVYRTGTIRDVSRYTSLYYEDGRTATVGVVRNIETGLATISTNGKPDGSVSSAWMAPCTDTTVPVALTNDEATQGLAPLIALAHAPNARLAAVVGQGTGMSSHFLLGHTGLEAVHTIEIEPAMLEGSRALYPANARVFDDPRSVLIRADARRYLATADTTYDLIFSEPSNPWVSGVSSLFSVEFYEHVQRYLADDGVFGQWLHLYEIDDALVLSILSALHRTFGAYEVFLTGGSDLIVVATPGTNVRPPDWSVLRGPELASDFCRVLPMPDAAMEAARVTHRAALAPLLDGWEVANTEFYPVVDLRGEKVRYLDRDATGIASVPLAPFDITAPFFGRRVSPPAPFAPPATIQRMHALALSAALQASVSPGPTDTIGLSRPLAAARYRRARWHAATTGAAPADWRQWVQDFRAVDRDLHQGTAGWADSAFFRQALAAARRHGAPPAVSALIRFRSGLASWDFRTAAGAARDLLGTDAHLTGFIPPAELLQGGVTAHLLIDDLAGAERLLLAVGNMPGGPPVDFLSRLTVAYYEALRGARP